MGALTRREPRGPGSHFQTRTRELEWGRGLQTPHLPGGEKGNVGCLLRKLWAGDDKVHSLPAPPRISVLISAHLYVSRANSAA